MAATFALLVAAAAWPAQAQSQADEARRHYRAGADLVRGGNCHDAIAEFRTSLTLVDSPNTRLLYARCLGETGDVVTALDEYARTERDAAVRATQEQRFASTRDAAHEEATQLESRVGRIVLTYGAGSPPEHVVVAGREIASAEAAAGIPALPGTVTIEARWSDGRLRTLTANSTAGTRTEIRVEAPEPAATQSVAVTPLPLATTTHPTDESHRSTQSLVLPIVLGGLGVAGLAASGGLYGAAWGEYGTNMNLCHTSCADSQLATGRGLETGSYVALGVGAALVIAGVVTFIVTRRAPAATHAQIGILAPDLTVRF